MDWSKLLETVLTLTLPPLVTAIVALLVAKITAEIQNIKNNKPDLAWVLEEAAKVAVQAAEGLKLAELIDDKKTYALQVAEDWLLARNIKVDLHLIEAAIESAVYEQFNKPVPIS
jgi:hypothetical protein